MGNNNSGHAVVTQPPPPWTQSLPRDAHRHKKYGAVPGTKVLPERIPGQRLKPTQNGRNLQVQGTISPRKITELHCPPPDYASSVISNHSSSMTGLNHHPTDPAYPYYAPAPNREIRTGYVPPKSFTSEPDLRGSSPTSHMSLPVQNKILQTTLHESPTKEKIKLKKRHKAPLPPHHLQPSISLPLERSDYVSSSNMSVENSSTVSSPIKASSAKMRKRGLFKKKCNSRMSNYEDESSPPDKMGIDKRVVGRAKQRDRSSTPRPLQMSSKKELKERAKSLDNLQNEIQRSSQGLGTSLSNLEVIDKAENSRRWSEETNNPNVKRHGSNRNPLMDRRKILEPPIKENIQVHSLEDHSIHRSENRADIVLHKRTLHNKNVEDILSSPVGDPKRFEILQNRPTFEYHRSSSSCSSTRENNEPKDEWDLAEEEWLEKKKRGKNLQIEISKAAKNLRKTSLSPQMKVCEEEDTNDKGKSSKLEGNKKDNNNDNSPKSFFFGMEPDESSKKNSSQPKTALTKLNEEDSINIQGKTVEYTRHSLRPKEKKNLEKDSWNHSLDYKNKRRSRIKGELEENIQSSENKKQITKKIEEFAAAVEREKLLNPDELSNSITRKSDGGYHSRQNSGSFHLEPENTSDEDYQIRMNLRPILPRRQLELPRFSPNAAWRLLSAETNGRQKETRSELSINEDIFSINEDHIYRYTRPTAPPRSSVEKSADSGISGDAGSPGPLQEFEPLTPDKNKHTFGPLAVSSPVTSGRIEAKRAWTPAQDLDENSFEENVEPIRKEAVAEISTVPKLTSRSNMFSNTFAIDSNDELDHAYVKENYNDNEPSFVKENFISRTSINEAPREGPFTPRNEIIEHQIMEDNWRENWSLTRSIPNSLNTCDEPDCKNEKNKSFKVGSESRTFVDNPINVSSPEYIKHSSNGHIMYLPEYKAFQMNYKEYKNENYNSQTQNANLKIKSNFDKHLSSPNRERKSPLETNSQLTAQDPSINPLHTKWGNQRMSSNGKKNKKFSYQSTVRVLEKKKLEEQLSKEVEEEEKRRLREVETMSKVEEEFQKKREREKKRLKQQLKAYQQQQKNNQNVVMAPAFEMKDNIHQMADNGRVSRYDSSRDVEFSSKHLQPIFTEVDQRITAPLLLLNGPITAPSYHSLPLDVVNSSSDYDSNMTSPQPHSNKITGIKKWVKGRRESRSGYQSDASSITVASSSLNDPDGAPASSASRKKLTNIRTKIIAASKHRNGDFILDKDYHNGSSSPAPSAISKGSHARTSTPNSKRTMSPDSRKSSSVDIYPRTKELPEMRQEERQYREYRQSERNSFMPNILGYVRQNNRSSSVSHNYRRDFCNGNVSSPSFKMYHKDDSERYFNDAPKSKESRSQKFSSIEFLGERNFGPTDPSHRQFSPAVCSSPTAGVPVPILPGVGQRFTQENSHIENHFSKGYQSSHITPFKASKGYQPVSFSPPPGKVVTVT